MSFSIANPETSAVLDFPDPLVVNPGRLSILMALASSESQDAGGIEFVDLRRQTRLTDGNLACHAKRLSEGGLIEISKQFRAGKPVTSYLLTFAGRQALGRHVTTIMSAIRTDPKPKPPPQHVEEMEEEWVD